jgi:peroxiredoxin
VELQEDYGAISGLGAEILAISTDDLSQAQYAVDAIGLEFPILSDQDAMVIEEYGVLASGISRPATFVLGRDGAIRWQYVGHSKSDRPTNGEIISQLQDLG